MCVAIYGCWFSGGVQVMELLRGHWSCCFKCGAEQPGRSDDDDLQTLVTSQDCTTLGFRLILMIRHH